MAETVRNEEQIKELGQKVEHLSEEEPKAQTTTACAAAFPWPPWATYGSAVYSHLDQSFQCTDCQKEAHFVVEKPQMPYSILQNFMAAVASVVYVIIQKYQMAVLQEERLWLEKDKLEAYFAWLETKMEKQSSLKSPLGKVIQYIILLHRR